MGFSAQEGQKGAAVMARMLLADDGALRGRVQGMVDQSIRAVMSAVNAARDGHLIDDSEVAVNDIINDLKRRVYEAALQARVDATEASFSPSGSSDRASLGEQGPGQRVPPDVAGSGGDQPSAVRRSAAGQRDAAG
jgi:hypothetical protein